MKAIMTDTKKSQTVFLYPDFGYFLPRGIKLKILFVKKQSKIISNPGSNHQDFIHNTHKKYNRDIRVK